jgi:hypothetical protein
MDEWWSDNQREFSAVPQVVPGTPGQGRCGGALLGTWVSVIAGSHALSILIAVKAASLSQPTLRRRVLLWKRNYM